MAGSGTAAQRWDLRTVPAPLVRRYGAEGWWTDESLGSMVATGLQERAGVSFRVCSWTRPWAGTLGDVDAAARRLAGSLRAAGWGPGEWSCSSSPTGSKPG